MNLLIIFRGGYNRIDDPETVTFNINKFIIEPLKRDNKVTVLFSSYLEDEEKLEVFKQKLKPETVVLNDRVEHTGQIINFKQTLSVIESVYSNYDYVLFLRFEIIYKMSVLEWDIFTKRGLIVPYREESEETFNGTHWYSDTIIIISSEFYIPFSQSIISADLDYFTPHYTLHNIANIMPQTIPVHVIIPGYYNSNTSIRDNPLTIMYGRVYLGENIEKYIK